MFRATTRAHTGLDLLSLALQLIQVLPTFWAAMLLVGFGVWISSLLAALPLLAFAAWWVSRRSARALRANEPPVAQEPICGPDGGAALDQLQDDVVALVCGSLRRDPVAQLPDIEVTTKRILLLLEEGQYPRSQDRLSLLAGMSLCVATDNDLNLGDWQGASSNVRLARAYGEIARNLPLQAWCCSVQSWVLALQGLPKQAALCAVSGQRFATTEVARRRLHGMHGNALALMGDKRGAQRAFDLARLEGPEVESDDLVDRVGGVFNAPLAKQYQNAAYGLSKLGLFAKAARSAEKAIQLYSGGPDDQRDYVLESGARVSLAIASVMTRRLDVASLTLRPTLELPPNRRTEYICMLMSDLQRALNTPRFTRSNEAAHLKAELVEFAGHRPAPER